MSKRKEETRKAESTLLQDNLWKSIIEKFRKQIREKKKALHSVM
jgi:hypothetical protein